MLHQKESVEILIAAGADVNALNEHNISSIQVATSSNRLDLVKLFYENGGDLFSESEVYSYLILISIIGL